MMDYSIFYNCTQIIKETYPKSGLFQNEQGIKVWYNLLKDLSNSQVETAVMNHVSKSPYPPTIADIRQACARQNMIVLDSSQAWEIVLKQIRNKGMYREQEALDGMPAIVADVVKRFGWFYLCTTENIMTDRARFMDAFERQQKETVQASSVPDSIATGQERTHKQLAHTHGRAVQDAYAIEQGEEIPAKRSTESVRKEVLQKLHKKFDTEMASEAFKRA